MFGWFKSKPAALAPSVVAPEVGAPLKAESVFPAAPPPLPPASYNVCTPVGVAGRPPQARFLASAIDGESSTGFRVAAAVGSPPLALVNVMGETPTVEIWQLESDAHPLFVKKIETQIDPAQPGWKGFVAMDGACLPGRQMVLGIGYNDPAAREALYLYDIAANRFRSLGRIEPDSSQGLPYRYFETWPAARDAALVLYRTEGLRLKAEVYVTRFNHLLLVSPRFPQGLGLLKLSLDDGNVLRWAMVGKTLWLQTLDRRNGAAFVWSLDVSKVL